MNGDTGQTQRDDHAREGDLRRFARALLGATAPKTADALAHDAVARLSGAEQNAEDVAERAFAELVRLNRRRLKSHAAPADAARERPATEYDRREGLPALIASMPLDERETLLIVTLAGFSYEAAGRILDLPYSTVMSRLMRARARLDAARAAPTPRIGHLRLVK
ncbi:MAG: sigma factor-like helix-turn-helix DNA-binding protein [Beijerinckiaceae bacterium]